MAGLTAAERKGRRAVLLVFGEDPRDHGRTAPREARRFLAQLGVPLVVWAGTPTAVPAGWGEVVDVSTPDRLRRAARDLDAVLGRQRIAWLAGSFRPQDVELRPGAVEGVLAKVGRVAELAEDPSLLRDETWRSRLVGDLLDEGYRVRPWPGARQLVAVGPGSDEAVLASWEADPETAQLLTDRGLPDAGACALRVGEAVAYRLLVLSRERP